MGAIAKAFKTAVRFVCTVVLSLFFGGGVSMLSFLISFVLSSSVSYVIESPLETILGYIPYLGSVIDFVDGIRVSGGLLPFLSMLFKVFLTIASPFVLLVPALLGIRRLLRNSRGLAVVADIILGLVLLASIPFFRWFIHRVECFPIFPEPPMGLFSVIHILACLLAFFLGIMWISSSSDEEVTVSAQDNFENRE